MLKDLVIRREKVSFGEHSFEVRGLTMEDLTALVQNHAKELAELFEGKIDFGVMTLKSPLLVAKLIAYASDEPDAVSQARGLPISVQIDALTKVWKMTIFDEESFVKQVRDLASGIARFVALVGLPEVAEKARPKFKIGPGREVSPLP